MNFKCIPVDFGVDVGVSSTQFFHFNSTTHIVTDLGDGKVRISRKIDGLHEIYITDVASFIDLDGVPVATTAQGLRDYFATKQAGVKAGEGVSVSNNTVSLLAGGPSTLGGFKVGTGLTVDGSGKLSAAAVSEVTKVLANETEMLAQPLDNLRPYRVIRLDTQRLYFLNAGDSPSVLSNWFVGPSIEAAVVSFKGRVGAVEPAFGDYNLDTVPVIDRSTADTFTFVIEAGKLYVENITTKERKEIAGENDLANLTVQVSSLDDTVNNLSTGLVKKVTDLESSTNSLNYTVNQASTGLVPRVATLESDNSVQDNKISSLETSVANKADLVSGKVPYEQLPDLPVGRKVNVANRAARLALPAYADLTIAYESDTGEAWALNANSNPAIDANWSKLGSGQAVGVTSFNGRTGNIGAAVGDYDAGKITELVEKRFVSTDQITAWDAKETPIGAQTKADNAQGNAKTYSDSTFIPLTQKNAPNGVAPLGAAGKVPTSNLLTNVADGVALLNASAKLPAQYVETGTASGVAPLGSASKVPMQYILTNTNGGVPLLDSGGKVAVAQLPAFLPQSKRVWRDVKATRTVGTWNTNATGNEMDVHVRAALAGAPANRFISLHIRENTGAAIFIFNSTVLTNVGTGGLTYADSNTITVPAGWQYQLSTTGGSTDENTERWYELS